MLRAAIYARFSSDKQSEKSIDDQVALCRTVCAREGLTVVAVYDDRAISGASTVNRLGWQRLMRDARADKFDVVVAEALDRISRDQEDLAGIHKRLRFASIAIRTAHDGVASELHIGVKGMLGALYLKDLAEKVRRGQAGVLRDGRIAGGKSYGYRTIPGKPGEFEIEEAEAAIVRRIFDDYRAGSSPRDIAAALNREGKRGPRGGDWNASTIAGSRKRLNGIIQNELYVGRIVWNRQTFIKNPDTGKRISRENPRDQWMASDAPHLRIIEQEVWDRVQARRQERGGPHRYERGRPTHLLSGLLKCGCCGSSYVAAGSGGQMYCSRRRETGLCSNGTSVNRGRVEHRVLEGIEKHLAAPELIAEYVREYHRAFRALQLEEGGKRRELEHRLAKVSTAIEKAIDVLLGDAPSRGVKERLASLEAERETIEDELAALTKSPVVFHPNAGEIYRTRIGELKRQLAEADEENRAAAIESIRSLVEKIVLHPRGKHQPVDLEIHGQMAGLLAISEQSGHSSPPQRVLVAGIGFEPMTFRL